MSLVHLYREESWKPVRIKRVWLEPGDAVAEWDQCETTKLKCSWQPGIARPGGVPYHCHGLHRKILFGQPLCQIHFRKEATRHGMTYIGHQYYRPKIHPAGELVVNNPELEQVLLDIRWITQNWEQATTIAMTA